MLIFDITFLGTFFVVTFLTSLYFILLFQLKPSKESKLTNYFAGTIENSLTLKESQIENSSATKSQEESKDAQPPNTQMEQEVKEKECPHYVGYLTTLPKGNRFPEECFGCRSVIQCLRIEPTKVIESFYIPAENMQ